MKNSIPEQTIIQRIQPECDTLHLKMKEEKEKQRKTNQGLSDSTGIPLSNIGKFFSGFITNPNTYYVAALCIELGISLDKLIGIPTEGTGEDAAARIHELEAKVHELEIHLDYAKKDHENLVNVAYVRAKIINGLLGICALLTVFTCIFLMLDRSIPDQGLFQTGYTSPLGILIIASVLISLVVIIALMIKKLKKDDKNE